MTRLRDMFLQENRRWAVIALCGTLLLSAFAQQPTPLPVSDVLTARSFAESSPIQFSPDGKWLAYTVRANRESKLTRQDDFLRAGVPTGAKGADIFVVETGTGGSRMVTGGLGENWLPVWSPNGHYLAMLSDRDGDSLAKLWIWEVATGTLRKVSEVNVRANQLEWLPDSRAVLVSILPEHVTPVEFVATLTGAMRTQSSETVSSDATVAIYRSSSLVHDAGSTSESPPWNLDYSLCDLAVIDVASGSVQRIDRGHRISGYFLAPDGSQVAYTSPQSFQKPGSQQVLFNVAVVSLSTGQLRTIASDVQLAFGGASVRWSPNSSMLAYRTGGMDAQGDCYVIDPKGGLSRNVTSFVARHAGYAHFPPLWDSKGRHIFFTDGHVLWKASPDESQATQVTQIPGHRLIRLIEDGIGSLWSQEDGQSTIVPAFDESSKQFEFYRIDLGSSRIAPLLKIGQNPLSLELDLFAAVSRDGLRLAYFSQDAQHDMDLWLTDPSFTDPRRLTHINPEFDRYQMGAARQLDWLSLDGELLHGALLLPSGYQEGERYPLIVWVYGGGRGSDSLGQFGLLGGPFNLQLFATRGYAVLFPDIPQNMGTPMADLAKAVLPGINKLIEMGVADASRLGIIGHSYGGYSVLSLIVQTKRFKAAVMEDGTGDLISAYGQMGNDGMAFGTSVAEQGQELMGGTPWEFRDRYIENSPIFFLDRIETPLLIVHGADDFTVAQFLGDEVFVDLRRLGKQVEYAKYQGEGHSPFNWSRANQLDLCKRVLNWFDKLLKAGPPQQSSSPPAPVGLR